MSERIGRGVRGGLVLALLLLGGLGCAGKGQNGGGLPRALRGVDPSDVLFVDDFEGERHFPEGEGRACRYGYREGTYVVRNIGDSGTCELNLWRVGRLVPPVRIELTVHRIEGSREKDYGLKFAAKRSGGAAFYTFTLTSDGTFALARRAERWRTVGGWRLSPAIDTAPGSSNHLAIELRREQARLLINERLVGTRALPDSPEGYVGFYLDEPGLEVAFDNLTVFRLR